MSRNPHFANSLSALESAARLKSDELGLPLSTVFTRVVAEWLGYDLEAISFLDSKDRGIDFWFETDSGFDIFQVKTHDHPDGKIDLGKPFDNEGVLDLHRVEKYLLAPSPREPTDALRGFRHKWEHAISSKRAEKSAEPIVVNLGLVILGSALTQGADGEWKAFLQSCHPLKKYHDVNIRLTPVLYTVDELIEAHWRVDNRDWKDNAGKNKDFIELRPENPEQILINNNTAVFYCKAIDLVRAYQEFGYQLFEPNVRCNIKVSKVNAAIRESVKRRLGREEFRFLNNGITMVCKSYQKPSKNKAAFKIIQPGVVNGLQTVCALNDAVRALETPDRQHFEDKSFVLVRLLQENSLKDVSVLVRATNTQNPMQARNLFANKPEQILFEQLFAEMGWFYERKQSAWEAFASEPRRWRSLPNRNRDDFQIKGAGRSRVRRVDNEDLAQSWLAFIGFSEDANHAKRQIFETDKWYEFVFLHCPKRHGADHNYKIEKGQEETIEAASPPSLMLAAYLSREFAKAVTPSPKQNKLDAIDRLKLSPGLSKDELEQRISEDHEYTKWQLVSGMSLLFVEYFGYLLFSAFNSDIRAASDSILENGSLSDLSKNFQFDDIARRTHELTFHQNDLLPVAWHLFLYSVEELVSGGWMDGYRQATSRNRYTYSSDTRKRLHKSVLNVQQFTLKAQLIMPWATGIKTGTGLFGFVNSALKRTKSARA